MGATSADRTDDEAGCIRAVELMATGTVDDFAEVYTADALDREADEHPPLRGPEGLHRSAVRLRSAFSDMRWSRQLGWLPPTPGYIVKMGLARRQAQREAQA